ncbi:NAD(P)H-dependent oxidoreductase [Candidatus Wolfebacteria bacterium]|nr:NAD(P)H-dependent oxidoreductase [Candidatus Wolfebacteria bacterium]
MDKKLFIPILLGTMREGRESEKVAKYLYSQLEKHSEIETQIFDVREMKFPLNNEGQKLKELNTDYRDAIIRADGLIIVSPEYNHGYPGSLKMALDILLKEYIHKAVGICAVSIGGFGGARMIEQLVGVVRELGMQVTFTDLNVSRVGDMFNEDGSLKDEKFLERVDAFFEELVWMAKTLRYGRENFSSKYHK